MSDPVDAGTPRVVVMCLMTSLTILDTANAADALSDDMATLREADSDYQEFYVDFGWLLLGYQRDGKREGGSNKSFDRHEATTFRCHVYNEPPIAGEPGG